MRLKFLMAALLAAPAGFAQPVSGITVSSSSGSGISSLDIAESFRTFTDVVVADVLNNRFTDSGADIRVDSRLVARRVLSGTLQPGEEFTLGWSYRALPNESVGVAGMELPPSGLLTMRRGPAGFQLLIVSMGMGGPWSKFLPITAVPPRGAFAYGGAEPLQYKMACEIGSALVDNATRYAGDLTAIPAPVPPLQAPLPGPVRLPSAASLARARFSALLDALASLDNPSAAHIYRYLSTLPDANLKLAGIAGRMAGGDLTAVYELESDLARLASSYSAQTMAVNRASTFPRVSGDLPAALAVARIAFSEITLQGIEGTLPQVLASTHSPEVLPYFMAMMDSPSASTRDIAMSVLCNQLLRPSAGYKIEDLWKPEMKNYCPTHSPLNDTDLEQGYLRYWRDWWSANRESIARSATLPAVMAPARWSTQRPGSPNALSQSIEVRFSSLVTREAFLARVQHSPSDPVVGDLSRADAKVYREVISATSARLDEVQKKVNELANAARVAGVRPDASQLPRRIDICKAAVEELHSRMSPEGWNAVERYLKSM